MHIVISLDASAKIRLFFISAKFILQNIIVSAKSFLQNIIVSAKFEIKRPVPLFGKTPFRGETSKRKTCFFESSKTDENSCVLIISFGA